ncbi:hypothetical protein RJ639_032690 [Escallonia herrerae]|uniref:X8 domain-containing protein n=1 Tax=Escallonia herrerae TaxID=1293975 RepID=A0AA88WV58_9ASTE|nr:hypothetical protein RJ639_032690 [Escallonia herrerae]
MSCMVFYSILKLMKPALPLHVLSISGIISGFKIHFQRVKAKGELFQDAWSIRVALDHVPYLCFQSIDSLFRVGHRKFRQGYDTHLLKPLLSFLRATGLPFLINSYPFFGCSDATLDYALFRPNSGVFDEMIKKTYTNMLDGQLDAVFSALKLLDFSDVDIVIAETSWPSKGEPGQVGADAKSAAEYNGKLMQHVTSGVGTPLMPNRTFETYIFALFNEDLKPWPTCERNFGLFQPDMTPVYNIGILRRTVAAADSKHYQTYLLAKSTFPTYPTPTPVSPVPKPSKGKQWCLPKSGASDEDLQMNLDYVCGLGLDCKPIQVGGACFLPDTV